VALEVFTRYARYVSVLKWLWLFLMSPWHSSSALETSMHYLMAVDAGAA
jgi:hypothetical protein